MLEIYINPSKKTQKALIQRISNDDIAIEERVVKILRRVEKGGDKALLDISEEIDGYRMSDIAVSEDEYYEAAYMVNDDVKRAIATAAKNIGSFHKAQKFDEIRVSSFPGVMCVQRAVPIESVGLYIPGGTAPLFSTVLMLAIPAKIAGCKHIEMCSPAGKDGKIAPAVLYAAKYCGVDEVYKVGGAQAIGAMAYGTSTIRKADKIFGPGNRYVTKAKQCVQRQGIAIDMVAGPSEVLVIADEKANPCYVAADLLSQAEHGTDSQAMLACISEDFAKSVKYEVERLLTKLPRKNIAEKALEQSRIVAFNDIDRCINFSNAYAPEHLILAVDHPWTVAEKVTAAGSVFIGNYSPESAGDYASGTNHTLPTSGTAVATSGVNLDSYTRKITYQELTEEGLSALGNTITTMARAEGLEAHALAVDIRVSKSDILKL